MTGGAGTMAGALTGIGLAAGATIVAGGLMMRTSVLPLESVDLGIFLPGSALSPAGGMVVEPQPVSQQSRRWQLKSPPPQPPQLSRWKRPPQPPPQLPQLSRWKRPRSRLRKPQPLLQEESQEEPHDERQLVVQLVLQRLVQQEWLQRQPELQPVSQPPQSLRWKRLRKQSRRRWPPQELSQQALLEWPQDAGVAVVVVAVCPVHRDAVTSRKAAFTGKSSIRQGRGRRAEAENSTTRLPVACAGFHRGIAPMPLESF